MIPPLIRKVGERRIEAGLLARQRQEGPVGVCVLGEGSLVAAPQSSLLRSFAGELYSHGETRLGRKRRLFLPFNSKPDVRERKIKFRKIHSIFASRRLSLEFVGRVCPVVPHTPSYNVSIRCPRLDRAQGRPPCFDLWLKETQTSRR